MSLSLLESSWDKLSPCLWKFWVSRIFKYCNVNSKRYIFGSTLIMVNKIASVSSLSCHVFGLSFTLLAVIHIDCHNNNNSVMLMKPLLLSQLHAWLISVLCQETFL